MWSGLAPGFMVRGLWHRGEALLGGQEHGGRLAAARRRFPGAPEPFLDLSTGINPGPYPLPPLPMEAFARLPEPEAVALLEEVAAAAYGAADPAMVVAAPGTQALISLLPRLFPARDVAVLSPTYGEHAAAWTAAGAAVREVGTLDALVGAEVAVLCNPNNPDGRRWSIWTHPQSPPFQGGGPYFSPPFQGGGRGGLLVIDEAFADLEPDVASCIPRIAEMDRAVVLRSFGKTYGLAGLRLGFAVAPPALAGRIRQAFGPWLVSGPALAIATPALADAAWLHEAAARCRRDAARLDVLLEGAGFRIRGGTCLFRLAEEHPRPTAAWAERLGRAGILVRSFAAFPGWLRFGLPGDDAGWTRLEAALGLER